MWKGEMLIQGWRSAVQGNQACWCLQ